MKAISHRRNIGSDRPHIFKINGNWKVVMHSNHWTHRINTLYYTAQLYAKFLNYRESCKDLRHA